MDIYKKLNEIGAIKFGNFILKSGINSPIYVDFRVCISHPKILKSIAHMIKSKLEGITFDYVLGVPYSGIFFACAFSNLVDAKMLMIRKEEKNYGSKKIIEGVFQKFEKCLIIDDVVTTGSSLLTSIQMLRNEGIIVEDVIAIFDRGHNTQEKFLKVGCKMHCLLNIFDMLKDLTENGFIDQKMNQTVLEFTNKLGENATV